MILNRTWTLLCRSIIDHRANPEALLDWYTGILVLTMATVLPGNDAQRRATMLILGEIRAESNATKDASRLSDTDETMV